MSFLIYNSLDNIDNINNITSNLSAGTAVANKVLLVDDNKNISELGIVNCSNLDVDGTITCKESLIIDTKTITSDELAVLDGVSAGTATEGKVLIVDSNKDITGINKISVQNLDVKGKTTIIDTVIMEAKKGIKFEGATINSHETTLEIIDPTETRTIYLPNSNGYLPVLETSSTTAITATPEEINILDGVTATTTDINRLEGVSAGAAIAGKALVASDNTKDVSGLGAIDCGAITSSGKLKLMIQYQEKQV